MKKALGKMNRKAALHLAAVTGIGISLSGCAYTIGEGGYYNDGYAANECDPYYDFDSYYGCDYGYGFVNIGFGGGWYNDYYYPGHGLYLFDTYGRRYAMHDNYRNYWGQRRYNWYRENYNNRRGHDGDRRGYGRSRHNGDRDGYDRISWPERGGG
ncbi:MAG: hypothetical protein HC843_14135 [Sphingomonadales bacterium]|nr:hypothetical protein [Sphingomonadales bacterium]